MAAVIGRLSIFSCSVEAIDMHSVIAYPAADNLAQLGSVEISLSVVVANNKLSGNSLHQRRVFNFLSSIPV